MSTRSDIEDGAQFDMLDRGIVYTEVLGWIDMGHARGNDVLALRNQFIAGERSDMPSYTVMYRQDMSFAKFNSRFGVGKFSRWDYYGAVGSYKNRGFHPILFPDPDEPCVMHRPYISILPRFLTWLRPWDDFMSGIVKVITSDGTSLALMGVK